MRFHRGKNLIPPKIVEFFFRNAGVHFVADRNRHTDPVASAGAETAGQDNFVLEVLVGDLLLQKFDDVGSTLQMAGRADAYFDDDHAFALISFSKKSFTVSGLTEKK